MKEAIERVIKDLELKRYVGMVTKSEDKAVAYENAIELLREVLESEPDTTNQQPTADTE